MKKPMILLGSRTMPMEEPFSSVYHYSNAFNIEAIRKAGGIPLMTPFPDEEEAMEVMTRADGLFLTGGEDMDPALYGQEALDTCGKLCPARDRAEYALLKAALVLKKPVLGVCRGCQLINTYFGGTLWQDIPTQYPTGVHHSDYARHTLEESHQVTLRKDGPLYALLGEENIPVNSLHHQGVREKAPALSLMAVSEDGIPEGLYLPGEQWLWAIQWHPEMMAQSSRADAIFKAFVDACR